MNSQERSTMIKKRNSNKKNKQSNFAKLSIFQPQKYKFKKNCPLSGKVLSGLIKRIDKNVKVTSINTEDDIKQINLND